MSLDDFKILITGNKYFNMDSENVRGLISSN